MDLEKLIGELYAERTRLDAAISALERAVAGSHKLRGRPPKGLARIRTGAGSQNSNPGTPEKVEAAKK